nr:ACP phosphodiesterase [Marinomonas ostreistagni]
MLGDFQWSPEPSQPAFYRGWRLHQAVDVFVDAHPQSAYFKTLPRQGRRRFAGIIQDIVMDYWLIQHWHQYQTESFDCFAEHAVAALVAEKGACPPRLQSMISSLEARNWLGDLGTQAGVVRAVESIQKRWRLGHYLTPFIEEMPYLLEHAEAPFAALYPEVLKEVQAVSKTL